MRTLLSLLAVTVAIGLTFLDSLPAAAPVAPIAPTVAQPVFSCPCGEVCKCDELRAENERLGLMVAALEARNRELTAKLAVKSQSVAVTKPAASKPVQRAVSCANGQCSVQQSGGLFSGRLLRRGR